MIEQWEKMLAEASASEWGQYRAVSAHIHRLIARLLLQRARGHRP